MDFFSLHASFWVWGVKSKVVGNTLVVVVFIWVAFVMSNGVLHLQHEHVGVFVMRGDSISLCVHIIQVPNFEEQAISISISSWAWFLIRLLDQ